MSVTGLSNAQPLAWARSMLSDFRMSADVVVRNDSSSGMAVGSRRGLGRLRHVQTRYLWAQQRVQQGDLRLKKEPGDTNVSSGSLTQILSKVQTMILVRQSEQSARVMRTMV